MVIKRPGIFIYTHQADQAVLKEICAGIEEEGVFFEVSEQDEASVDTLAFLAAKESMTGSGIGVSDRRIALQMRGLPEGRNVARHDAPEKNDCRRLGANSARAIKKLAFK